MTTKTLSSQALAVIDRYLRFKVGAAVCSVPYFNNKTARARATLRAYVGKGDPEDILEETKMLLVKRHVDASLLSDESLKKILTDANIGIDCSGFTYHVLATESDAYGHGPLDSRITFVNCTGIFGKMRCSLRPAENCDVATFADDANSRLVTLRDVSPGDIITMVGGLEGGERDHILLVHDVSYEGQTPTRISYSHAVAYPKDGVYGTGVRQGSIRITDPTRSITDQLWIEGDTEGTSHPIFIRAIKSRTELRRLK